MRLDENGHEDVMAEAVSLIERIEFRCPTRQDLVILGMNSQGWLFVYLGSDPMYRFDKMGRLRRAFVAGYLFRTEGQSLAMLERQSARNRKAPPPQSESILLRRNLTSDELDVFRIRMRRELNEIAIGLRSGDIIRQHPADATGSAQKFQDAIAVVLNSQEFLAPAIVRR